MKLGLVIAALAFVVMFFVPERRCEGNYCKPRPLGRYVGDLVKIERVDGKPVSEAELEAFPGSACLARPQLDAHELRFGDCEGDVYAAYFWAQP